MVQNVKTGPFSVGVIGGGRIGQIHAQNVFENPDTELVAICDPFPATAEIAERLGAAYYATTDELLDHPDIDAVIVASPTAFHADTVERALETNKAVLVEKPLAETTESAEQLIKRVGLDAPVMVGFNRRFDPSFQEAKRGAASGKVGPVRQLSITSRDPAPPSSVYLANCGGLFKDMTIHDFDMVRNMLGEVVQISAVGMRMDPENTPEGEYDGAIVTLVSEDGAVATITNSRHSATGYDQRLEVFGDEGSAQVDNLRPTAAHWNTAGYSSAQDPYLHFFLDRYAQSYKEELKAFVAAVKGEQPYSPGLRDGLEALRMADAAQESSVKGHPVSL